MGHLVNRDLAITILREYRRIGLTKPTDPTLMDVFRKWKRNLNKYLYKLGGKQQESINEVSCGGNILKLVPNSRNK